jgi:hypothetical protein
LLKPTSLGLFFRVVTGGQSVILERYVTQCLWQLACTGRTWCDLVSYDDRLPEPLRLHVTRIERDDERIGELEAMVVEFLAEVDSTIERLRRVAGGAALITIAQMNASL